MNKFILKTAFEIDIEPAKISGQEHHGLLYFLWEDNTFIGAQCSKCNIVVWVDGRSHNVLNEEKPQNIPNSGIEYRKYYQTKLVRFMKSLPPCPDCGSKFYDRFVNNTEYPRFADGTEFVENSSTKIIKQNPHECLVWVYE